eukprot:750574-Hanusia_phi.AAC.1
MADRDESKARSRGLGLTLLVDGRGGLRGHDGAGAGRQPVRNLPAASECRKRLHDVEERLRGRHVCGEGNFLRQLPRLTGRSQGETILGMQKSKQGMERLEALGRDLERMYQ